MKSDSRRAAQVSSCATQVCARVQAKKHSVLDGLATSVYLPIF